jgi:ATP-dependent helicase Lhr and Lhr-like helicase
VVLVDGELAWFLERGGRSLLSFTDDPGANHAAAVGLAELVAAKRVASLLVERVNGVPALTAGEPGRVAGALAGLVDAGFARTPRGLRLR